MSSWHPDDVLELRRSYGRQTNAQIARRLHKSRSEISVKASELALAKDKRAFPGSKMPRWSADELELLRSLYPIMPSIQIAKRMGRSLKSVSSKGVALGLRKNVGRLREMGRENVQWRRDRVEVTAH
jgi:hypothetical protein